MFTPTVSIVSKNIEVRAGILMHNRGDKVLIRPMTIRDIDAVVHVHELAFPSSFMTRMGPKFLRHYYSSAVNQDGRLAFIAEADGCLEVLGFAVGFLSPGAFYKAFGRLSFDKALLIVGAIAQRPALLVDVVRNLFRVGRGVMYLQGSAELASIAVAKQGCGVGGRLLATFLEGARRGMAPSVYLTTDSDDNDSVRMFYEERGFICEGEEVRGRRHLSRYVRIL